MQERKPPTYDEIIGTEEPPPAYDSLGVQPLLPTEIINSSINYIVVDIDDAPDYSGTRNECH